MKSGFNRIFSIILAVIICSMIGVSAQAKTSKNYVKSVSVKSKATITIPADKKTLTKSYKVTVKVNGTASKKFTAKSSKTSVATVKVNESNIKITAKKAGKATVTVTAKAKNAKGKKLSAKLSLTVKKQKAVNPSQPEKTTDNDTLYSNAVRDAVFADEDEIMPLVNISKDDENVIWKDDKVLVAFMHKYPDSYPTGEEIELKWGNVWCVSAAEMQKWVKTNSDKVENWTERLHQVMGLPLGKNYTSVTALWVDANLLYRPANVTDPTAEMKTSYQKTGDEDFDTMYKAWFDSNIIWSYFDSSYPWTRLGYTYDWADNGKEYGLSEFLIFSGAKTTVEYTYSLEDYVNFAKAG